MRRLALAFLTLLIVLGAPAASGRAGEAPSREIYDRRQRTIPQTVHWLLREAAQRGVGQLLIVFDVASFAPPPGITEFSGEHLYADDLGVWVDALVAETVTPAAFQIRLTSSLATKSVRVGAAGWPGKILRLVERAWWKDERIQELEPAWRWINRLLLRTEGGIAKGGAAKAGAPRRMLVLISGNVTPERWSFVGNRPTWESTWRPKLLPVGKYWDAEEIAARLDADGCCFYAIAPEAHFGDFRPFVELPQAPWAARPKFPPLTSRRRGRAGGGTATPSALDESALRELLDKAFEDQYPDPVERKRAVEAALARLRNAGAGRGALTTPASLSPRGWRFDSTTPYWFPRHDGTCFFNNHAPSGYGYWPFARVVAKTGGRYAFYPFPISRWLDVCPRDLTLLDRLAPELIHETKYLSRRRGDRACDALARAVSVVVDDTPWSDSVLTHRANSAWSSFARVAPIRFHADWSLRQNPFDDVFDRPFGTVPDCIRMGQRLKEDVLPRYDKALEILDRALADEARSADARAGGRRVGGGSHPRSVADLRLLRFWFSMSAFHLDALATYAIEVERFIPESMKGNVESIWVTYIPTIKMSDCLDAYDGRTLSLEDEAQYERWVVPGQPLQQGNILLIDGEEPDYRAKRSLARVLEHIDPRLKRRAIDMIFSADRVMGAYAESGWGWTTYYSIGYTFLFYPIPVQKGSLTRPGGRQPPPPPTTPQGPSTPTGRSNPGGPTTGG